MSDLINYLAENIGRGECRCGKCDDSMSGPELLHSHSVNMEMFQCFLTNPDTVSKERFETLVKAHKGVFNDVAPFDGEEHSYIELGGWVGDQGVALTLMALGYLLGSWNLITPSMVFKDLITAEQKMQMAQSGLITIVSKNEQNT